MNGVTRRGFLSGTAALAIGPLWAKSWGASNVYETTDGFATDSVMVRRLYLALVGKLPTESEAMAYVDSSDPNKKRRLVETLLSDAAFADYWSMRFCDILRVKSEFPINLWPNAVYVYHRRIRDFLLTDEPWDHFARQLLTSTGSDFRDAEVNFYRATAQRTSEGYAEIAAQTFLGEDWRVKTGLDVGDLAGYFDCVQIKKTREWKEEIVYVSGRDRRSEFCDRLTSDWRQIFANGLVSRVSWWMLGQTKLEFADAFERGGWKLKSLIRTIAMSTDFARGPISGGFICRRLDAEVLDDVICDLTGAERNYQSIAPEPFTFLPANRRSVLIEDGSISNSFLTLFGRPARDIGTLNERQNVITAKQRLYLFNSGRLHGQLSKMIKEDLELKRGPIDRRIDRLYWRFVSRPATAAERKKLMVRYRSLTSGRDRWLFTRDVAWALMNSKEFLYQH